jgi:hypothetical protein
MLAKYFRSQKYGRNTWCGIVNCLLKNIPHWKCGTEALLIRENIAA